ncbi:MAG: CotH kinase family protein [Gemmatimonadaceae bacterium]|nr:CotH kinase family protein [Gemmatimonadaceae bacterium]
MHRIRRAAQCSIALLALAACGAGEPAAPVVTPPPLPPVVLQPATLRLPLLSITTADGADIVSKDVYVPGTITLADSTGTTVAEGGMEIRGRGNTTWSFPKKPYRLKLTTSTALLGMPANRHWVLLANYSDKTMLRTDLAFELSRMIGMPWTSRTRYVDLNVNGQYRGVYQLAEHVRIGAERVNIPEMKASDTSAVNITGGYLLEVDERRGEEFCFNSTMTRMVFCAANPETLLLPAWSKQRAYIQGYINRTDSALFGSRFTDPDVGYAAYIDVESAINYYLLQEALKNVDGGLRFGPYMYKQRNGKLFFGPVWDFDLAIGNVNYDGADRPDGWHARRSQWFVRLFEDPAFKARAAARWAELQRGGTIDSLKRLVYSRANYLSVVQVRNFERWPILGTYVWPNRVVTGAYDLEVIALNVWLQSRLQWVDAEIRR